MPQSKDPYKILGVPRDAGKEEIKKAYYRMARKYHPDQHLGNTYAEEMFKDVASAYEVLSDDELRARYDQGRAYRPPQAARNPDPWGGAAGEPSRETVEAIMGLFAAREAAFRSESWFPGPELWGYRERKRMIWFMAAVVVAFVFALASLAIVGYVLKTSGRNGSNPRIQLADGEYSAVVISSAIEPAAGASGKAHGVMGLRVYEEAQQPVGTASPFASEHYVLQDVTAELNASGDGRDEWYEFFRLPTGTRFRMVVRGGVLADYAIL